MISGNDRDEERGTFEVKKSSFIALSIFILASLSLAACSKNDNQNANSSASASQNPSSAGASASSENTKSEPIKLSITWWGNQPRHDATNKVLDLYTQKNPNVTFSPEFTGFDGYYDKLTMLAAANNMPDIFQWYVENDQYFQKGLVAPLDDYVNSGLINTDNISQSILDTGKLNGKLYGISLGINAKAMAVDPAMYEKAGLTVPENGYASWEDLEKDLLKLKAVTGAYGADDVMDLPNILDYYARQNGQYVFDPSGLAMDEKTFVSYYDTKLRFIKEGLIPPVDVLLTSKGLEDSALVKGKAAVAYTYSSQFEQLEQAAGRPLKLIPLPGPNQDKGLDVRPGMHFAISSSSKHKEEAAKFINFFVNDIEANEILKGERGVPISSAVRDDLQKSLNPAQQQAYQYMDYVSQHSSPNDPPTPNNYTQINDLLTSLNEEILYGKTSPSDAYKTLKEQATKLAAQK